MPVRNYVAVLRVVTETRVSETKILRNVLLIVFIRLEVLLELFPRSLFKRDPRKVSSKVEPNARHKLRGGIARGYENSGR